MSDGFLSFSDVCNKYGITWGAITEAVKRGILPQYRIEGFRLKRGYKKSEVERWLNGIEPVNKPNKLQIKFKRLHTSAIKPERATPGSMGYDVTAISRAEPERYFLDQNGLFFGKVFYGLGLAFEIPLGECAFLLPRSSINKHNMYLANSPGTIDSDYRNEVKACFYFNNTSTLYEPGERIGQLVFWPNPNVELIESEELSQTDRTGGFGSTGK